jgi:type 1 glutamine amidotransferase
MHRSLLLGIVGTVVVGAGSWPLLAGERAHGQAGSPPPAFERAPDALPRVTWRTRTLVGEERLTNWKLAVPANGVGARTFLEGVVRADAAVLNFVEGSNTQLVSTDIQKPLDHRLAPEEISKIRTGMGTIEMLTYRIDSLPPDATARRSVLAFARVLGADTVIVPPATDITGLDALAEEVGVNVAVLADSARPGGLLKALTDRGKRLGIALDTGLLAQEGVPPAEAVTALKDRLLHVRLRDRSGRGAGARNVPLGQGSGKLADLFRALNQQNVRPLTMTLDTTDVISSPGDLFKAVAAFEDTVQPAYGENFTAFSKTRPIRRDVVVPGKRETLAPDVVEARSAEVRGKIDAAIPKQPYAKPAKARKLLVIESLQGMSHNTIPHTNVMLERMGEITGAWETVFSNDLANLRYPAIKQFDAIFLNSIVGEFLPDPQAREDLARYVREGGGLGGIHGTPWASRNWEEFAEMIGAQDAPHRIEEGIMKVYDPASPLVAMFGAKPLPFREEYYRFRHEGPARVRWDKVRVLLTVELDDAAVEPRPWTGYKRPDNIYPVTWIRNYGKGRVFYCSLGHMPETFMAPELVGHFLAGIQFVLGDLKADTTPNPPPARTAAVR